MPYVDQETRERLKKFGEHAQTGGDLNYLITLELIRHFKEFPRYRSIHEIYVVHETIKINNQASIWLNDQEITLFVSLLNIRDNHVSVMHKPLRPIDFMAALQGAISEFDRRIVGPYEDQCIKKNGDVYDSQ